MSDEKLAWSQGQEGALTSVRAWLEAMDRQVFRLFGYAGTGKTQLAREVSAMIEEPVLFASCTGKASLVLGRRVGEPASTLHRLLYQPQQVLVEGKTKTIWVLRDDSPLADAGLLVVDEASMVDEQMGRELLGFDVPLLVLGDPFQLPPIKRVEFFASGEPDAMLTEVYRHQGPVLDLATEIRIGGSWRDQPNVTTHEPEDLEDYDVIICGTHQTRRRLNRRLRIDRGPGPEPGDKLICIRTDYGLGIFNGQTFTVIDAEQGDDGGDYELELEDDEGDVLSVAVPRADLDAHQCQGFVERRQLHKGMACLTWGYAITAHKSQGSQWDNVLVFDESARFNQPDRWLYTAVTRAAERVTVVTVPNEPPSSL